MHALLVKRADKLAAPKARPRRLSWRSTRQHLQRQAHAHYHGGSRRVRAESVGPISGANNGPAGDATNVVTDYVRVRGESRHDAKFVKEVTAAYRMAFKEVASLVTNAEGNTGRVQFTTRGDYQ